MTQPLQVQDWPVEKLIPYARNARTHSDEQLAQIAASIREFGFTNPILIDSASGIIAGHGRLAAARKLQLKSVPVIVLDHLTETQKRAYILADNKLALNAGWDNALLALEFEDLKLDGFDLELTGFSDAEIEALETQKNATPEGLTDDDSVPKMAETPVSVSGDVWVLGSHRLLCGDATSIDAVERLMDGSTADLIVTDPPYNVAYVGKTADALTIANDSMSADNFYAFLREVYTNLFAVAANGACIYVFHADLEGINFRRALIDAGWKLAQ